uniref:Tetratricopeptide repeat protein 39B n=1 Tax=Mastacembelus armatus TaxID=205130 RepID=A0A7N8WTN1_9TELE
MDLEKALKECYIALNLFLNNRFADALNLLSPWKRQSMYHAMGYSSILVMQAGMTFEQKDIDAAMTSLSESLQLCQRFRKKSGIVETLASLWYKQPTDNLTEEEMHAELCYAEVLLQKAVLTFLDESFISFMKGGMGIRKSYLMYKFFFSTLSFFNKGTGQGNLTEAEALLEPYVENFPNVSSALLILIAQERFLACIAAQEEWRQIHHMCYWELMWAYSFEQNWREAYRYADLLSKNSKWSQAIFVFQKAAILSMLPEEEVTELRENVVELFRQVDGLRLRFAGKSIPTEKFAAKKAERYSSSHPVKLVVPALEMMYVWNGFSVVGKRPDLIQNILTTLVKAEKQLEDDPKPSEYHVDNQCVVQLLKGLCLKELGHLVQAELCFNHIISSENNIKHDHYLVPFTMYELGLLHKERGDIKTAITVLENVK